MDALETIRSLCRPFSADIAVPVVSAKLRRPGVATHCPRFNEDVAVSDRPRRVIDVLSESIEDTDRYLKLDYVKIDEYQRYTASVAVELLCRSPTVGHRDNRNPSCPPLKWSCNRRV
jgi:hypothetical protein